MADRIEAGVEYVWDEVREREDGTLAIDDLTAQAQTRVRQRHEFLPQLGACKRGMVSSSCPFFFPPQLQAASFSPLFHATLSMLRCPLRFVLVLACCFSFSFSFFPFCIQIRHMYLVVDLSQDMEDDDMK